MRNGRGVEWLSQSEGVTGELAEGMQMGTERRSTFEDLEVWQASRTLRTEFAKLARRLPPDEKFRLTDQILRASRSVTANIAEGYGRFHYQENIQFCRQARGSLFELIDHLTVLQDEGFLDTGDFKSLKLQVFQAIRMLNGYVKYLKRRKSDLVQS